MLAILCPGQGSQAPGFLRPWAELPELVQRLRDLSPAAGFDLLAAGCDPDADVVDTAIAQPLIVATGVAVAELIGPLPAGSRCVGHSVGELTAAAVAGACSASDAVRLAAARGRAMAAASATTRGGMVAVLGGEPELVSSAAVAAGAIVANHNGPGQLVAAGARPALDRFLAEPPAGARLRELPVAGAFHTDLMAPAVPSMRAAVESATFIPPSHHWISNADGAVVTSADELGSRLVQQVTRPVRWDRCIERLSADGVTSCLELPPAGTLTAIVRRAIPGLQTLAVRGVNDLEQVGQLIAAHTASPAEPDAMALVVAPAAGTWRPARQRPPGDGRADGHSGVPDSWVELGAVVNRSEPVPVVARTGTTVVEWLAVDGDPVREGQPLARLAAHR